MAKQFEFEIANDMHNIVFSVNNLIKTKMQLLDILLRSIRYIMYYPNIQKNKVAGKIIIIVDKMSRIFFFSNNKVKYYTIPLPMTIMKTNNPDSAKYEFELNGIRLTSELISSVIQLINSGIEKTSSSLELAELFDDVEIQLEKDVWSVFRDLLLSEEGYVRYDEDTNAYNEALKKEEPKRHPKNHLDIFLHSHNQFKIGLNKPLSDKEFIDILNLKTDCYFLHK